MILQLKGFGELSILELALIFTVFGAFLVFFGFYIMLRKHKSNSRRKRFAKKQFVMEQALNDKLKWRRDTRRGRDWEQAEAGQKKLAFDEKDIEEGDVGEAKNEKGDIPPLQEAGVQQRLGGRREFARKYKGTAGAEIFQENRRISHRREQLQRLEEGTR